MIFLPVVALFKSKKPHSKNVVLISP